jgi:membrane-associated protein
MDWLVEAFSVAVNFVLHMDVQLNSMIQMFGPWIYVVLFLIIFCETGLVVTPFLPGDSLLFALGALTSVTNAELNLSILIVTLIIAAILGNTSNYFIGSYFGPKVFASKKSKLLNQNHLKKTQAFYERYGGKTIVLSRFIPIVRTFAPFVAGIGKMNFGKFQLYNIVGAVSWIVLFTIAGHYFGNIPAVKSRFHLVIAGILVISLLPIAVEWWRGRRAS